MDILSLIRELYINAAQDLPDHILSFLIRANLLILCSAAAAYAGRSQGIMNQKVQSSLVALGALIGIGMPVDFMMVPAGGRPVAVFILMLGCWFHPLLLAKHAHTYPAIQVKIIQYTRISLAILFILNLFLGGVS